MSQKKSKGAKLALASMSCLPSGDSGDTAKEGGEGGVRVLHPFMCKGVRGRVPPHGPGANPGNSKVSEDGNYFMWRSQQMCWRCRKITSPGSCESGNDKRKRKQAREEAEQKPFENTASCMVDGWNDDDKKFFEVVQQLKGVSEKITGGREQIRFYDEVDEDGVTRPGCLRKLRPEDKEHWDRLRERLTSCAKKLAKEVIERRKDIKNSKKQALCKEVDDGTCDSHSLLMCPKNKVSPPQPPHRDLAPTHFQFFVQIDGEGVSTLIYKGEVVINSMVVAYNCSKCSIVVGRIPNAEEFKELLKDVDIEFDNLAKDDLVYLKDNSVLLRDRKYLQDRMEPLVEEFKEGEMIGLDGSVVHCGPESSQGYARLFFVLNPGGLKTHDSQFQALPFTIGESLMSGEAFLKRLADWEEYNPTMHFQNGPNERIHNEGMKAAATANNKYERELNRATKAYEKAVQKAKEEYESSVSAASTEWKKKLK